MIKDSRKIIVVEDEHKIAEVVKSYLENEGFEVLIANNGSDAFEKFEKHAPVLLILDLMLPDISGEEICKRIRKTSRVPIIMLTAKVEEESVLNGLDIGADDYVMKPFSPKQLVARVYAVLRRTSNDLLPLAKIFNFNNGELIVNSQISEVKKNRESVNLTPIEYKILMTLLKYPKKTFTREELINSVMGEDFDGYDRTIDVHIKNLRQKIETDPRAPIYILTVYGLGYKFGGEINEA